MLFSPITLGKLSLKNRIAMAPMTRSRSDQPGDVPNDLMATYYAQRASAGLIISEGAPISAVGRGYSMTPGIYTQAHIEGWKKTTQAVHQQGGHIFIQLWHVGRRSHSIIAGQQPLAPSAVKMPDKVFGPLPQGGFGMIETEAPKAMSLQDIQQTIADFAQAAANAIEAGFDGVELHGAHGYLIDTFLRPESNLRDDQYGGSPENRIRFMIEAVAAVAARIGADKVGIRLSPFVQEGLKEAAPEMIETTLLALQALDKLGIAYVHFSENIGSFQPVPESFRQQACKAFGNTIIVAGQLDKPKAEQLLAQGYADMAAFGKPFITNPDLVERLQQDIALTPVDSTAHSTFYGGGAEGYTDYAPAAR